jgi:hypothetical protein
VVSDRGQHGALVEKAAPLSREFVAALSIGVHLANNLLFTTLAFGMGRLLYLSWWDVLEARPGACHDFAAWAAFEAAVVAAGVVIWPATDR